MDKKNWINVGHANDGWVDIEETSSIILFL